MASGPTTTDVELFGKILEETRKHEGFLVSLTKPRLILVLIVGVLCVAFARKAIIAEQWWLVDDCLWIVGIVAAVYIAGESLVKALAKDTQTAVDGSGGGV